MRRVPFKLSLSHQFSQHKRRICSVSIVSRTKGGSACFMASRRFYGLLGALCGAGEGSEG